MGTELVALGAGLLVAGFFARFGRRIGLPTIPLFMLAGLLLGPNTPGLEIVKHPEELELLATIGLVFLLFNLGLEFSMDELVAGGTRLFGAGSIFLAINVTAGVALGFLYGWGSREALVLGGCVGISSSAIATKLVIELKRLANPETRVILGIAVVEDIFLALYLAILQPVLGDVTGTAAILASIGKAFAFLIVLAFIARTGAGLVSRMIETPSDELITVGFVGLVILVAGIAEELGVSDAIGAFMVGLILAESPSRERIERLALPLRDTFAAVFFFAFGLTIDPGDVRGVLGEIAIAVVVTIVGTFAAAVLAGRLYKLGRVATANLATTVLARGEFALIFAALAASAGLDPRITAFVAGYVLVLALGAPILAVQSKKVARFIPPVFIGPRA